MYKECIRPAWVEINLSNLDYNIKNIKKKVGPDHQLIGVVKADAYGHGSVEVAKVLWENGVRIFAVATLQEGVTLREGGIGGEVIMLGLTPDMYADTVVKYDITPVTCSAANVKAFSDEAVKQGKEVQVIIAVDTGMGRIGYQAEDLDHAAAEVKEMEQMPGITVKGMISHMSVADCIDKSYAMYQAARYQLFAEGMKARGVEMKFKTFANSACIMEIPSVYYDAVRPGIILYGLYPSDEMRKEELDIKPVMSVKANIAMVKEVPAGFSVGYGRKYVSQKPAKIATLTIGYADGYPRELSPNAWVLVNGYKCHVAGNICMDQCMVDVTEVPDVKAGDEVIIMGTDGKNTITAEYIGQYSGTICNEVVCAFGQRLPKVYVR